MSKRFSVKGRVKSFGYAFSGMVTLLKEQHNAIIHVVVAACVVVAGFFFNISSLEWVAVLMCFGMVIAAEAFNSAIEYLCDFVSPGRNELIKKVKDVSAAAVLVTAIASAAIGLIIFIPRFVQLW